MKTTMKQLTAGTILTLIMLVGNVNAEGTQAKASSRENAVETTLQIEKWMIDNAAWNSTVNKTNAFEMTASDETLQIENWMTDTRTWDLSPMAAEVTEPGLKVEDWMLNSNWELNNLMIVDEETQLTTENWMFTGTAWFAGEYDKAPETALVLENWMINDNVWK